MKRAWLLVLALACASPLDVPRADVSGTWLGTGRVDFGAISCWDTLSSMRLVQDGTTVRGTASWRYTCGDAPAAAPIPMRVTGIVDADSVGMRWSTDTTYTLCGGCLVFIIVARVLADSMAGRMQDHLGGVGTWSAVRR